MSPYTELGKVAIKICRDDPKMAKYLPGQLTVRV